MRPVLMSIAFMAGLAVLGTTAIPSAGQEKKDKKAASSELPPAPVSDVAVVKRNLAARQEYEESLKEMRAHYIKVGDKQRADWSEQELLAFHLMFKPSYNLDVNDVPPPTLEATLNVKEANELYKYAMEFKGKGFGDDYVLNQRRAEMLLRELLEKYPHSDKISDVAYNLGDIYESRAYRQYDRAARYYERSFQWVKGSTTDARLRAAVLYDRQLNERSKAIELYRSVVEYDIDPGRIKTARKRLDELTAAPKN